MLVLARKKDQSVWIGDDICLTVERIKKQVVTLYVASKDGRVRVGKDEQIWIGDDVRLTIVRIDKDIVRLGFDAPRSVVILRDELKEKLDEAAPQRT